MVAGGTPTSGGGFCCIKDATLFLATNQFNQFLSSLLRTPTENSEKTHSLDGEVFNAHQAASQRGTGPHRTSPVGVPPQRRDVGVGIVDGCQCEPIDDLVISQRVPSQALFLSSVSIVKTTNAGAVAVWALDPVMREPRLLCLVFLRIAKST